MCCQDMNWYILEDHKVAIRERERERYYTYPALRLIQVLPGHPLADPKDETVSSIQRRTSLRVNRDVNRVLVLV